jgi:hypothetical protein
VMIAAALKLRGTDMCSLWVTDMSVDIGCLG